MVSSISAWQTRASPEDTYHREQHDRLHHKGTRQRYNSASYEQVAQGHMRPSQVSRVNSWDSELSGRRYH